MALDFTGLPVDNILLSKIDAPIGTYRQSDLTPAQFNAETPGTWVLANGQDVTGSEYEQKTGKTNVPDARSRYLRSKDHSAGRNPSGDLAEGASQSSEARYSRIYRIQTTTGTTTDMNLSLSAASPAINVDAHSVSGNYGPRFFTGYQGNETRPETLIVNTYIKIGHS